MVRMYIKQIYVKMGMKRTTICTKQLAPTRTHEKFIANDNVIENIYKQTDNTTTAGTDSTTNPETVIENSKYSFAS